MSIVRSPLRARDPLTRGSFAPLMALYLLLAVVLSVAAGYELAGARGLDRGAAGIQQVVAGLVTAQSVLWHHDEAEQVRLERALPVGFRAALQRPEQGRETLRPGESAAGMRAADERRITVIAGEHGLLASRLSSVEESAHRVVYVATFGAMIQVALWVIIGLLLMLGFCGRESFRRRRLRAKPEQKAYARQVMACSGPAARQAQSARSAWMSHGEASSGAAIRSRRRS